MLLKHFGSDVRYGLRMMKRAKAFALIAVLTLAIGIGANTAMFSVIYGVLLRPLPLKDPHQLVLVWHTPPQAQFPGMKTFSVSPANYFDWKAQNHVFSDMAIYSYATRNLTGTGEPKALIGRDVSPSFFSVLQASPMLGRTFAPDEDQPGRDSVIVLSYKLWKSQFGGDSGVIGRTVSLDQVPHTIIGVMPRNFYQQSSEFWAPLSWTPASRSVRGEHHYVVLGRLKSGVDLASAQAEMNTISSRLAQEYPVDNNGWGALVVPFREEMVGDVRPALLVLLGAVFFVLLIACVNVANLMLAKILDRRKEIAIRSALGASRTRILQQVLAESILLAAFGGALGVVIAVLGVQAIVTHLADHLPRIAEISVNSWVLFFTVVISIAAGLITGLIPAWRLSKVNVNDSLKQSSGRGAETGGTRARSALVVAEVALSLMLLAGAGLLLRSLWKLQSVDPGFDPRNVLTASISVPDKKFDSPQRAITFLRQIHQQVRNIPGVESAALVDDLPLVGGSIQPIAVEGRPAAAMADQPEMPVRRVSADYFQTMHIRVLRGREFADSDLPDRQRVVIVSQSMASKFWPDQEPIGKRLALTFFQGGPREVVGVVDDIKIHGLDVQDDVPTVYVPVTQLDLPDPKFGEFRAPGSSVVLRTKTTPGSLSKALADAVHQVDSETPVLKVETMEEVAAETLAPQRFNLMLLGVFAALALLLAALGIYSVLAYSVRRRTQEIGIRMAMGAQIGHVLRLILGEGMLLVLIGVACGLTGTLALSRFLRSMLFNVGNTDITTYLGVAALLSAVALAACYLPARRAVRIDPLAALREE